MILFFTLINDFLASTLNEMHFGGQETLVHHPPPHSYTLMIFEVAANDRNMFILQNKLSIEQKTELIKKNIYKQHTR